MSASPTPAERLSAIVEQGLCIGCGICQAVAGPERIGVAKTTTGSLRPIATDALDHELVDTIYDVCPGTRVDGLPAGLANHEAIERHTIWGPWRRMVRAWAGDPSVRFEGSTGGVLTALGQYLIRSERVSFVLHTKASTAEPTFGEPTLSFTEADVFDAAGSRYGPTATLIDIDRVLDRGEPFAFIGKPCDIGALRNLGRFDERVDQLVRYWLTPVCGGYGPPEFTEGFLRRIDVDPDELAAFRYRGRGCPGPTTATTAARTIEKHYLDYWGEDESAWSLPWRCKICPDGIGESADLAVADTWIGGSPNRDETDDDPGTNAVIARTTVGVELIEQAVAAGALIVERDIGPAEMDRYQPHQVKKKQALPGRFAGLADEGRIVPTTDGLRIEQLRAEVPVTVTEDQRQGTRERIAIGKATEPPAASAERRL